MADVGNLFGLQQKSGDEDAGEGGQDAAEKLKQMKAEGRREIDGTPPHLVEAMMTSISRLALGRKLYTSENKLLGMMEERVEESWRLVAARDEPIAIDITPDSLMYHDHVVFSQPDRDTIAHRLHRDSVRRLVFSPKCNMEEILRFLTVFDDSEALWQHEADCADKLWILNLKGIKYQAVDGFDELVAETRGEAVEHYAAALDQFAGDGGALGELAGKSSSRGEVSDEMLEQWGETRRVPIKPAEINDLGDDIRFGAARSKANYWNADYASPAGTFEQFVEMLEYVVTSSANPITNDQVQALLERLFHEQLATDDGDMARRIEGVFAAAEPIGGLAELAWRNVVNPDLFTNLLAAESKSSPRRRALQSLMEKYLKPSAGSLVRSVVATESLESARPLLDMLSSLDSDDDELELWVPHLDALTAEFIAAIVERLPAERFDSPGGHAFSDAMWKFVDPERAALAMRITPAERLAERRDVLLSRLEDPLGEVRIEAAYALARLADPTTGIYVLNILRRAHETGLSQEEIRALLKCLTSLGGDRYVPFLEQCLGPVAKKRPGLLFGKRKIAGHVNPIGNEACVQALVRLGTPAALTLLRHVFSNTPDTSLKSYIGVLRQNPDAVPGQSKLDTREHAAIAGDLNRAGRAAIPAGSATQELPAMGNPDDKPRPAGGLMKVD